MKHILIAVLLGIALGLVLSLVGVAFGWWSIVIIYAAMQIALKAA